jgi:hypothetical protein
MSETLMKIPYAELSRTAGEALRMIGITIGQADDAAQGLIWTQTVLGLGCACARSADESRPSGGWKSISIDDSAGPPKVSLAGNPLLFYANRIKDFVIAIATGQPAAQLSVSDTSGGWLCAYIAGGLAASGRSTVIRWRPTGDISTEAPPALFVSGANSDMIVMLSAKSNQYPGTATPLPRAESASAEDIEAFKPSWFGTTSGELDIAVAARPLTDPLAFAVRFAARINIEARAAVLIATDERYRQAIETGLTITESDRRFLGMLTRRRLVPTSERSKRQAG